MSIEEYMKNVAELQKVIGGMSKAEQEAMQLAMSSKASEVIDKISGNITNEEITKLRHAIADPLSLLLPKVIPAKILMSNMSKIFDAILLLVAIGYYCGKTGDFMETV